VHFLYTSLHLTRRLSLDQQGQGISLRKAGLDKTLPEVLPTLFVEEGLAATPIGGGEGGIILQIFLCLGLGLLHPPQLGEGGQPATAAMAFFPSPLTQCKASQAPQALHCSGWRKHQYVIALGICRTKKKTRLLLEVA